MADGSTESLRKIFEEAESSEVADSTGTVEKRIDEKLISLDDGEITESRAIKAIRTPAQDFKIELETEAGRKLEVFPDHRVRTDNGVKKARAVEEGDMLLTPLEIDTKDEDVQYFNLAEELSGSEDLMVRDAEEKVDAAIDDLGGLKQASEELGISKKLLGNYRYRGSIPLNVFRNLVAESSLDGKVPETATLAAKRDKVEIPSRIDVDSGFMKLLGYYLAEGYTRKSEKKEEEFYQVCFAFGEEELKENIADAVRKVFGSEPSEGDHVLTVSSRVVYEFFRSMEIGSRAREKRVPEFVKSLPRGKVAEMLSAYFAGDGSVEKGRLHVQATSASRKLLDDIDFLLKRFGIYARYSTSEREAGGI
ncbi:MAG: LAGLIDADG family homing endonuclease, partial [Candidatus Bipolaricaulia bacterium]